MLYKFKSHAAAELIMLEAHGRRLLEIIGKDDSSQRGILQPDEMPAAIAALEAAIAIESAARQTSASSAEAAEQNPDRPDAVTLRQRATPFIEMLRRCLAARQDIVWGV